MTLVIGHLYPDFLNLYGDSGNVEVLAFRAKKRNIGTEVVAINLGVADASAFDRVNVLFMGGGPDSCQNIVYEDFLKNKKDLVRAYILAGKAGLFICGAYQLLGSYYKDADGHVIEGLDIFDLYTEHPGNTASRCIGNVEAQMAPPLLNDPVLTSVNTLGNSIVGFENHGGRTYLGEGTQPLGFVSKGFGNNQKDKTEGALCKNCIGTYLHGPFLAKNPHMADFLIAKALGFDKLEELNDKLEITVHTASKKLKQ